MSFSNELTIDGGLLLENLKLLDAVEVTSSDEFLEIIQNNKYVLAMHGGHDNDSIRRLMEVVRLMKDIVSFEKTKYVWYRPVADAFSLFLEPNYDRDIKDSEGGSLYIDAIRNIYIGPKFLAEAGIY
ncbi:hypothetical protein GGF42_009053 [Coemansia sp. RSA 2424]|nr:hypothetical protein GGF42_009053 [Coemansia sp. RSA 2424]